MPGNPSSTTASRHADVDAELERGGGDHAGEATREELVLDRSPLLGEVAAAVGAHAAGERPGQAPAHVGGDDLDAPPAAGEAERGVTGVDEPGRHRRCLAVRGARAPRGLVEEGRLPQGDGARASWRAVVEHGGDVHAA